MALVQAKLFDPGVPVHQRQRALDRALSDPGIPSSHASTKSFWLNDCDQSLATRQSSSLPSTADIVIVGSGITGISVAHSILEDSSAWTESSDALPRPRVLLLEAREFCSGATGRNGGHILETADEFDDLETTYGTEAAVKLTRFRLSQRGALLEVASKLGISDECQARNVEFVGAYFDEEAWQDAKVRVQRLKNAMPKETEAWKTIDREEIPPVSLISSCFPYAYSVLTRSCVTGLLYALCPRPHAWPCWSNMALQVCHGRTQESPRSLWGAIHTRNQHAGLINRQQNRRDALHTTYLERHCQSPPCRPLQKCARWTPCPRPKRQHIPYLGSDVCPVTWHQISTPRKRKIVAFHVRERL
jgi:hypothetical protein